MKHLLIIAALLALAGCASLNNAGTANYDVRPFIDAAGAPHCCEVSVRNGKEIANLKARIEKRGDDYIVELEQQGVQAFAGQAIAAGAQRAALDAAARAAVASALAPVPPVLVPAAGAALASGGLPAAAAGAGAVIVGQEIAK